ncbi:DUF6509 family protein [Psychrobacillus sp. FSL K6-4046]|uniref:DUF6509 family protein n=1 Tax=Psychrobacillus sp. FSL K6-4046 TaxID=2921550 RepID=UPI003159E510
MNITSYEIEKIKDPTGIIAGDRYEFLLGFEVPEDDELFEEASSLDLRVILAVLDTGSKIVQYHILDRSNGKVLDYGLEENEESVVLAFCMEHYNEAE